MSKDPRNDASSPKLISGGQSVFTSWTTEVLLNIIVLGLFVEYSDGIVIDSFTIVIFTAVVLKALLGVTFAVEHRARNFFWRRGGTINRVLGVVTMWAILFSSKFVILEIIDIIFRDDVEIDGFVPLVLLIITMIVAERAVEVVNERLGGRKMKGTAGR